MSAGDSTCCPLAHEDKTSGAGTGRAGEGFDLVVIGAGSAGFSAAIAAAEQGAQVALVGHGTIGGTCVNVGCVPSKTMIRAVEICHQAQTAARFSGVKAQAQITDWAQLVAQKQELVTALRQAKYLDLLPQYERITYLEGQARLAADGVAVGARLIRAPKVILATGTRPLIPDIAGLDTVPFLTSTEALALARQPRSLTVLGAGYVGCELAQMFARAGTRVQLVYRSRLLPQAEPEISAALAQSFAAEGIALHQAEAYEQVSQGRDGIRLTVRLAGQVQHIESEHLLITAGRRPNTEALDLPQNGVALLPNGGIRVDAHMETARAGLYAAGDVTGRDPFVYMAAYGGRIAASNAVSGNHLKYDNTAMPAVVFTDPQMASVGLTEARARARGLEVRTSVISLDHVPRALAARDVRGLIKLVAARRSGQLLGAHILAPEGADSIQTAALAIRQGLTVKALGEMIFPYLTTVEGLKLAAQAFDKDVTMLSCCAG